eukprot:scpid77249/ scgid9356/ 
MAGNSKISTNPLNNIPHPNALLTWGTTACLLVVMLVLGLLVYLPLRKRRANSGRAAAIQRRSVDIQIRDADPYVNGGRASAGSSPPAPHRHRLPRVGAHGAYTPLRSDTDAGYSPARQYMGSEENALRLQRAADLTNVMNTADA